MHVDFHYNIVRSSLPAFAGSVLSLFFMPFMHLQAQFTLQLNSPGTYIMYENTGLLQLDEYTLECWLMIHDAGISVQSDTSGFDIIPLIAKGYRDAVPDAGLNYLLGIREEDRTLCTVFEEQVPAGFPRRYRSLNGYTSLKEKHWYHAAVTFNGVSLCLYVNGSLESMVESDLPPLKACRNNLSVGTALDADGTWHGFFHGGIDGIRLWNYARSHDEIRQQLNNEILVQQSGLILALNLNEGEGRTLHATGLLSAPVLVGDQFTWNPGTPPAILLPPSCSFVPELSIGLIADPQYGDLDPMGTRFYRESLGKLDEAVDTFNARKVDLVMTLGDMTDRYYESFDSVRSRYARLDAPDYALLGNHEFEQVTDSLKHTLTSRLGMPGYYYDFTYKGWQFLVLDATELGAYARVLHPELAEEGDSLWQHVSDRVNAHEWNGGISRSQLQWIRQKLTASYEKAVPVVIFCHHQVFPFNRSENLWNDTAVADLIGQFPNVVTFINGHNHKGDYGFYRGVHFLTQRAMVETKDINSYSILTFYPDRIEIDGRGLNRDQIWSFNREDTLSRFLRISNTMIKTSDSTGSCIGTLSLQRNDAMNEQASFQLDEDTLDGQLFSVSGDTLFLKTNENLSGKGLLQLRIHALNCLRHPVSNNLELVFDSITIFLHRPLPDTVADVNQKSLSLPVDKVFSDSSRLGISLFASAENPEKATVLIENDNLICRPHQLGETRIFVTARDPFTGFSLTDTLLLKIRRIYNHSPFTTCTADTLYFTAGRDTIVMLPDTMFADPDGDTLGYEVVSADPQTALVMAVAGKLVLIAAGKGETEIMITASDPYGGATQLIYPVIVRDAVTANEPLFCRHNFNGRYNPLQNEIVVYSPLEKKGIQMMMTDMGGNHCDIRFRASLSPGTNHFPMAALFPPGGYVLVIRQGNIILHTQKILITPIKH